MHPFLSSNVAARVEPVMTITNKAQCKVRICSVRLKEPQGVIITSLTKEYKSCSPVFGVNSIGKDLYKYIREQYNSAER